MRIKNKLRLTLASLLLASTASVQAITDNFYNGIWYNENLGYIISKQNGENLVGVLLQPAGYYLAFMGKLTNTEVACAELSCPPTGVSATLKQLFVEGTVELQVSFSANNPEIPPTQAEIEVTTCDSVSNCILPVGFTFEVQKIF